MRVQGTERLLFRDHEEADMEAYGEMESDAELERSFREGWLPPKPMGLLATVYKPEGRYVGRCGLYPVRRDDGAVVPGEARLAYYLAALTGGGGWPPRPAGHSFARVQRTGAGEGRGREERGEPGVRPRCREARPRLGARRRGRGQPLACTSCGTVAGVVGRVRWSIVTGGRRIESRRWLLLALPRMAVVAAVRAVTGIELGFGDAGREALARDQARLDGAWFGVSQEANGQETPAGTKVVISAGNSVATNRAGSVVFRCAWKVIDATATPKQVDLVTPDGQVFRAVYRMRGDTLQYCGAYGDRPEDFSTNEGDGRYMATLNRASK
jgi:uncharacterized protein (TIGR03067 family)